MPVFLGQGSIPGLGRSPGEGNGNPLQSSFLENLMDRGPWQATVHGVARVGHDLATKPHEPEVDPHQTPKLPAPNCVYPIFCKGSCDIESFSILPEAEDK